MRIPVQRVLSAAKYFGIASLPIALLVLTSGSPILAQTFPMAIQCTSTGQTCTPVFSTPVAVAQAGPLTMKVTASSTHCSNVGYIVSLDGNVLATTPFLTPGQSSGPIVSSPVSTGPHTVTVQGIGTVTPGGCNSGTLGSWAGTLVVSQTNTLTGANVSVPLGAINVAFANVTAPGTTLVTPQPPPIMPPGFAVFVPAPPEIRSVDISTTATFTGPITIAFDLAGGSPTPPQITPQQFSTLRVLHQEIPGNPIIPGNPVIPGNPIFVNRTVPAPQIVPSPPPIMPIYAQVSSLSPFVIAQMSDKIVFSSNRDGNSEIYSMNSDGTGSTRLTNNPAVDAFPAWSPDRSKIAFTSNRNGNFDIYSMNADGSSPVRLTSNAQIDGGPAWSPDGTKIAFTSARDGNFEIYSMNPDGTGLTRLTNNPGADANPTWSPDGTRIAFMSTRDGHFQIYSMNADGTSVMRLTNNSAADISPAWSPDGTKIAFASNRNGLINFEVYAMNADGSGAARLTNNAAEDGQPAWSPDGAKIIFTSNRTGLFNFQIYTMNADGTGLTRLTTDQAVDLSPQW